MAGSSPPPRRTTGWAAASAPARWGPGSEPPGLALFRLGPWRARRARRRSAGRPPGHSETSSASTPSSLHSSRHTLSVDADAGQRPPQPLALQRLDALELLRRRHEDRLLGRQDSLHPVVGPIEDGAHLRVDRPRGLLAVVALAAHPRAPQEERRALAERREPDPLGHAVLRDHQARDLRRTLEVVVGARRHLAVDQLLGDAATEEHRDAVLELATRHEE